MLDIQYERVNRGGFDYTAGVNLSPRDVSDALRLMNLLLNGRGSDAIAAVPSTAAENASLGAIKLTPKAKARAMLKHRQTRARHFRCSMFSEPAWDILLTLFANEDSERRMRVTELAVCNGAPLTTTLRWIDVLEQAGLIVRRPSPLDRRVMFVDISPLGTDQMNAYLDDIANWKL